MSSNILTYSIAREWLQGSAGTESFSMHAWSGGRRGTKTSGAAEHSYGSYNVFRKEQTGSQPEMIFDAGKGLSTEEQQYDPTPVINDLRGSVADWRKLKDPKQWLVTSETARLLEHWRRKPEMHCSRR